MIRQAQESLQAYGLRPAEAESLLEPVTRLLGAISFWKDKRDGLALFISPGVFRQYQLPTAFEPLVVVAHRFHLKPLLAFLGGNKFFVLALSQNEVRLFEGSVSASASSTTWKGCPKDWPTPWKSDEQVKNVQFRTGSGVGGARGERAAMFHGQSADDAKDKILRYFRQIYQGLQDFLREEPAPLVLAGVEYLLPIYKEANTYPHLLGERITGNPEGLSSDNLHRQAWALVEPHFRQEQEKAAAWYRSWRAPAGLPLISVRSSPRPTRAGWNVCSWRWAASNGETTTRAPISSTCTRKPGPAVSISWHPPPPKPCSRAARSTPWSPARCRMGRSWRPSSAIKPNRNWSKMDGCKWTGLAAPTSRAKFDPALNICESKEAISFQASTC